MERMACSVFSMRVSSITGTEAVKAVTPAGMVMEPSSEWLTPFERMTLLALR